MQWNLLSNFNNFLFDKKIKMDNRISSTVWNKHLEKKKEKTISTKAYLSLTFKNIYY